MWSKRDWYTRNFGFILTSPHTVKQVDEIQTEEKH